MLPVFWPTTGWQLSTRHSQLTTRNFFIDYTMSLFHPIRDARRKRLTKAPFPSAWVEIIDRNVPYCQKLSAQERLSLWKLVAVFINEKHFEGCVGQVITQEIKLTVAAQACLLLLNLEHNFYEKLRTILVYPAGFEFNKESYASNGIVSEEMLPVAGVSYSLGVVALSWSDTTHGARRADDGTNVTLHEFAHQLDLLDNAMNGAPILSERSMYPDWARVLGAEFEALCKAVAEGLPTVINPYGATNPAEFFAVVTELFFEKPIDLKTAHPALYEEFRQYYGQDPATRFS